MNVVPMNETSREVAQRTDPAASVIAKVREDDFREQLRAAAPPGLDVNRFVRVVETALREDMIRQSDQKKWVLSADRTSLYQAVIKCATDGLLPDGKQAALVVYGGKVQYLPMIAGVRKIAGEYGWTIKTHVVFANDFFEFDQATDVITHKPPPLGTDRGEGVGGFAVAFHRDGRHSITEVMDKAEIMKRREVAKTKNVWDGPFWQTMWEKTLGHRIAKKLPLDPQDRERLNRVLDAAELEPGEAAAALYGEPTEAASFAELPPPAAAVAEAEPEPLGDGEGAGSSPAETPPADPDAAGAAPQPSEEVDEEVQMLAAEAAEFVPPTGRFADGGEVGPLDLAAILDLGDEGRKYLTMCLGRLADGEWRDRTEAFCRVHMPDEYAAAIEKRAA